MQRNHIFTPIALNSSVNYSNASELSLITCTMAREGEGSIFKSLRQFHGVLRCFGLAPYELNGTTKDFSYSARFIAVYLVAFVTALALGENESVTEESLFMRCGNHVMYLLYILNIAFSVAFNYTKREEIVSCMLAMHHFDCMLLRGGRALDVTDVI
jgi:hypothetical protein